MPQKNNTSLAPRVQEKALETALLAGKLLMASGAETERVEDTVQRMLRASLPRDEALACHCYATLTCIFVRLGGKPATFTKVEKEDRDLTKVAEVNAVSRAYTAGEISLGEAHLRLVLLQRKRTESLRFLRCVMAGVLGAAIVLLFGGTWRELPAACLAGAASYTAYHGLARFVDVPFLMEFVAAVLGGFVGYFVALATGGALGVVLLAAIAPLVPGIGVTNALRDIVSRHYLTGMMRFLESVCIAAALGGGAALVAFLVG